MLVPHDHPRRALRVRRQFMAVYSYLLVWAGVVIGIELGLFLPDTPHWALFLGMLGFNLLIHVLIRTGWSERLRDPSLTTPQMMAGIILVTLLLHFTVELRGGLLVVYFMVMTFGVFALDRRRMLRVSLFALVCYTGLEIYEALLYPQQFLLTVSFGHWGILLLGLLWFVFIGGYIYNLQQSYRQQSVSLEEVNARLHEAMEKLEELATHDDLTGLLNRRCFLQRLDEELARCERTGMPLHLAMLDLDHFKAINDTHGHGIGDAVLRGFAGLARSELRRTDLVARYGGEEFAVLLPHGSTADIEAVMERLRMATEHMRLAEAPEVRVTVSGGITRWHPGDSADTLLHRADEALYRAKAQGRNQIRMAESPASPENR